MSLEGGGRFSKPKSPEAVKAIEQFPGSIEELRNWVDFRTLSDIYTEMKLKSGIDAPAILNGENIQIHNSANPESDIGGATDPVADRIDINLAESGDTQEEQAFEYLHAVIHEKTHEVSHTEIDTGERSFPLFGARHIDRIQTGFSAQQNTDNDRRRPFGRIGESLNEAVTEKLAVEVLGEYVKRKGLSAAYTDAGPNKYSESYENERAVLESVLEACATALEVDQDTVWRGIVRQYLSGELQLEDFNALLAEVIADPETNRALRGNWTDNTLSRLEQNQERRDELVARIRASGKLENMRSILLK